MDIGFCEILFLHLLNHLTFLQIVMDYFIAVLVLNQPYVPGLTPVHELFFLYKLLADLSLNVFAPVFMNEIDL